MMPRWGVSPIGWVNDDLPELGAGTRLETILTEARDIGFAGIERGHLFPSDPRELAEVLGRHDLDLIGAWYGSSLLIRDAEAEIAAMADHLALLRHLGSDVFIIAETASSIHGRQDTPLSARPRLSEQDWAVFGARLDQVAAHVAEQGLRLAYHYHLGTVVQNAADLDRLLAATKDQVGLVIDTGHAFYGGIDPAALVRRHPARVIHVHAKDVRPARMGGAKGEQGSFLDGVIAGMFTVPGDGAFDFAPLFDALVAIDYAGWIVIEAEQDPAKANPQRYARLGLKTLQGLCP